MGGLEQVQGFFEHAKVDGRAHPCHLAVERHRHLLPAGHQRGLDHPLLELETFHNSGFPQPAHGPMQHQPGHGQRSDGAGLMPALRANRSVASASSYLIGRQRPARSPGRVAWNLSVAFTGSGGWPNASSSTSLTKPDGDTSRA